MGFGLVLRRPIETTRLTRNFRKASPQSRAIIGSLDILVDIGVPAEKEVIQ